jgi:hypothetical protein
LLEHYGFYDGRSVFDRKLESGSCLVLPDGFNDLAEKEGALQSRLAHEESPTAAVELETTSNVAVISSSGPTEPAEPDESLMGPVARR